MTNKLSKNKTFIAYEPGVQARAGSPAIPATPARAITELKPVRIEVPASAMEILYGYIDRETGKTFYTSKRPANPTSRLINTPLMKLREALKRPGLTAEQAHYWQLTGLVDLGTPATGPDLVVMPLSWSSAWVEEMRWSTTVIPATAGRPAIPAVAGTPASMTYDMHLGWNAGARSEVVLEPGSNYRVSFTTSRSIGAVIGLAQRSRIVGMTRRNGFNHIETGIAVGEGRARLVRNGEFARSPFGGFVEIPGEANIENFTVEVSWGSATWRHEGTGEIATVALDDSRPYVLDAVLFCADDYVDNPAIKQLPAVTTGLLAGGLRQRGLTMRASMQSPWYAEPQMQPMQMRAGGSAGGPGGPGDPGGPGGDADAAYADITSRTAPLQLVATAAGAASAQLVVRGISAAAGVVALGLGNLRMHPLDLDGEGDSYWTPSYAVGSPTMHPLVLSATALTGGVMSGALQLEPMWMRLSETVRGEAALGLEALHLDGGLTTGTGPVDMVERLLPTNEVVERAYVTVVIAEGVRGQDYAGTQVLAFVSMIEQLDAQTLNEVRSTAMSFMLEQIGAVGPTRSLTFSLEDGDWTLMDDSAGWAVNEETGGSTRYEGFGFNSFAAVNGRHIGVRANGLYLLEGDTDAGRPIHAGVHLGKQEFGTSQLKDISNIYLGVSSEGKLFIKVGTDKAAYTYAARRVDPVLKTQRYDLGRGLRSNYYTFDLVNDDGSDFELEKIEFVVLPSNRRI